MAKGQRIEGDSEFAYINDDGKSFGEVVGTSKYNTAFTKGISFERASRTQNSLKWSQIKTNELGMTMVDVNDSNMINVCLEIYNSIGLVKNVIDLMSDFTVEGIDLVHPNKSVSNFWKKWIKKTRIIDRSERMVNTILKAGTCAMDRKTGKITSKQESDMKKATAAKNRVIPIGYKILNPKKYKISKVDKFGKPIIEYNDLLKGNFRILNNEDGVFIATYKKDDWEPYAKPFHYAALQDLALENKMRRMDDAVMDGAINAVRIWKMGGFDKSGRPINPSRANIAKLAQILNQDTGGGVLDIIWDQFIDLQVEYPPVDKILGSGKYEYVHKKILEAFGIAQVLVDGTGQGSYSNQYLSVRSLMEKIQYMRNILEEWLVKEVEFTAKAMGFRTIPSVSFKNINLGDENARMNIVMSLYDRNIISKELMLDYMEHDWKIEKERIIQEKSEEEKQEEITSYGPFKQREGEEDDLVDNKILEKNGGDGRPPNQPTKPQEKQRTTKPQGASVEFASLVNEGFRIQHEIDETVNSLYLAKNGVKNVKQLTKDKKEELDKMKFYALCKTDVGESINKNNISKTINSSKVDYSKVKNIYKEAYSKELSKGKNISLDDIRNIRAVSWALSKI